jgi:hypothetical protein
MKQTVLNGRGYERCAGGRDWIEQEIEIIDNPNLAPVAVDRGGNVVVPTTFGSKKAAQQIA